MRWTDDLIDAIVREFRDDFAALNARLDRRDQERKRERELAAQHRREDRKFIAQTCLAVMALLVTATGIIVTVLA